jgi:type II secretory pathway predicted ATPase ExeA
MHFEEWIIFYFSIYTSNTGNHMAELSYLATIKKKFGWEDFPFSLDLIPEVFAGKEKILNPIMEQLVIGNIVYIEGNYGSGKSQVLKHLQYKMRNDPSYKKRYTPVWIQEPVNTEILTHAFTRKFDINARIGLVNDLTDELEGTLGSKKLAILLIDEAQELAITEDDTEENIDEKKKTLQWLRVLSDFRGCRIFLAGLVNFGNKINEMFRPLEDRVTLQFFLEPLDFETTVDLIKKRISFFSEEQNNPISPFSDDAYKAIYQISGGYPRAILKYCQDAVIKMLEKGKDSIDADDIYSISGEPRRVALSPRKS